MVPPLFLGALRTKLDAVASLVCAFINHAFLFPMISTNSGSSWNSAIFSSFPFVAYRAAFVTSDFQTNSNPWEENPDLQSAWRNFTKLNNADCISRYLNSVSGAGDVVVVTSMTSTENDLRFKNDTSLIETFELTEDISKIVVWVCSSPQYQLNATNYCWAGNLLPVASSWSVNISNQDVPVQYCLAEDPANMDDWCGLHFNTGILIIVCAVNFFKAVSVLFTWAFLVQRWHWKRKPRRENEEDYRPMLNEDDYGPMVNEEDYRPMVNEEDYRPMVNEEDCRPMVTVGDAVQSFLRRPDDTTQGMCLASQRDFLRRDGWTAGPRTWEGEVKVYRFKLASKKHWISTFAT
jgi:hypothetical protein